MKRVHAVMSSWWELFSYHWKKCKSWECNQRKGICWAEGHKNEIRENGIHSGFFYSTCNTLRLILLFHIEVLTRYARWLLVMTSRKAILFNASPRFLFFYTHPISDTFSSPAVGDNQQRDCRIIRFFFGASILFFLTLQNCTLTRNAAPSAVTMF